MKTVLYDSGVLVSADKNERRTWAEHKARLEFGVLPVVPAPVVAQVSRSARQSQLRRFLAGCRVVAFGEQAAHEAGRLLGVTRTTDVVDAAVVVTARQEHAAIITSDPNDISRLAAPSGRGVKIFPA